MDKRTRVKLSDEDQVTLKRAYKYLEHPSFAARLSDVLAAPIEEALSVLPKNWRKSMDRIAHTSVYRSLKLAMLSMGKLDQTPSSVWSHKILAGSLGAASGFFGPLTILAELPIATTLMMRSIADVARSEGEDLTDRDTRVACVQVFALGGRTKDDEAADIGYYALRLTLGLHFERDILKYAANAQGPHIPAFIELTRAIAARFGVVISDKVAAQMVPIAGALTGATLNLVFMQHYQDVARGHFSVRRLERQYGVDNIRREYPILADEEYESEEFSPVEGW